MLQLLKQNFFLDKVSQKKEDSPVDDHTIKELTFYTINEIKICNKIKELPYHFNDYKIVVSYKRISEFKRLSKIIDDTKGEYVMLKYNIRDTLQYNLKDHLTSLSTPKEVILFSLETYIYLLNRLLSLHKNKIVLFDLHHNNIFITKYKTPILSHFENSILLEELNEEYITKMIKSISDFTYKPLEVHLLFYLIINNEDCLSASLSYEICEHFIKNMHVLSFFDKPIREKYKKECTNSLNQYINKPRSVIITDIIKYSNTWDNYGLSMLYLHIFFTELNSFSLKETFMTDFLNILFKNISANPVNRLTLENTLNSYNEVLNTNNNWSWVNKIHHDKIELFRSSL
uniref:Protein kinase domain-containing protein n=1 Tax=viral metagenome TaxID=1070528 RepID=A0A6C0LM90_9ZZZZ